MIYPSTHIITIITKTETRPKILKAFPFSLVRLIWRNEIMLLTIIKRINIGKRAESHDK